MNREKVHGKIGEERRRTWRSEQNKTGNYGAGMKPVEIAGKKTKPSIGCALSDGDGEMQNPAWHLRQSLQLSWRAS